MKYSKRWQRLLAGLLSTSMVFGNLSAGVGGTFAYAAETEAIVSEISEDTVENLQDASMLPNEGIEFAREETAGAFDESDTALPAELSENAAGFTVEDISVISDGAFFEPESETESESESESESETEFAAEMTSALFSLETVNDVVDVEETEAELADVTESGPEEMETVGITVETEMPAAEETAAEPVPESEETVPEAETEIRAAETEPEAASDEPMIVSEPEVLAEEMEITLDGIQDAKAEEPENAEAGTVPSEDTTVLALDTPVDVKITEEGGTRWFSFTPDKSGTYRFASTGKTDTFGALYMDPEGEAIAECDDGTESSTGSNFVIEYALEAGTTYYLEARMCYAYITGSFQVSVSWVNYAIQSVTFTPERQIYYAQAESRSDVRIRMDVVYTDGQTEQLTGRAGDSSWSNITKNYLRIDDDIKVKYVRNRDVMQEGTYHVTASYLTASETFKIQVRNLEEIAAFPEDGAEGDLGETSLYLLTVPESGVYAVTTLVAPDAWEIYQYNGSNVSLISISGIQKQPVASFEGYENVLNGSYYPDTRYYRLEAGQYVLRSTGIAQAAGSGYQLQVSRETTWTENTAGTSCAAYAFQPSDLANYTFDLTGNTGFLYMYDENWHRVTLWRSDKEQEDGTHVYSYQAGVLNPEKTYHLFVGNTNTAGWSLAVQNDSAGILTEDVPVTGNVSGYGTVSYYFRPSEDGYYQFRLRGTTEETDEGTLPDLWLEDINGNFVSRWSEQFYENGNYEFIMAVSLKKDQVYTARITPYASMQYQLSVSAMKTVSGIEIAQLPAKVTYSMADVLDMEGLQIRILYADGTSEEVAYNSVTSAHLRIRMDTSQAYNRYTGFRPGTHEIFASYLDYQTSFRITVTGDDISTYPVLVQDQPVEGTVSGYRSKYYKFTPEVSGFYSFTCQTSSDCYFESTVSVYDSQWSRQYYDDARYYLRAGETYAVVLNIYYEADDEDAVPSYTITASQREIRVLTPDSALETGTTDASGYAYYGFTAEDAGTYVLRFTSSYRYSDVTVWDHSGEVNSNYGATENENGEFSCLISVPVRPGQVYLLRYSAKAELDYTLDRMTYSGMEADPLTEGESCKVNIDTDGDAIWYSFTPSETAEYVMYSQGKYDTYVELYLGDAYNMIGSDDDGGPDNNFYLKSRLQAGVTYFYRVRMWSSSATGSFQIAFCKKKDVNVKELEIKALPQTNYTAMLDQSLNYEGLVLTATYEDGSTEDVAYGEFGSSGEYIQVSQPSGLFDEDYRMVEGDYNVTVSYAGMSVTYPIHVGGIAEMTDTLKDDEEITLTERVTYRKYVPAADGLYEFRVTGPDNASYLSVLDESGNDVSYISNNSFWYEDQAEDGSGEYGCERWIYELKGGKSYCIKVERSDEESESEIPFGLSVSALSDIALDTGIQVTAGDGETYYELKVTEQGFYRLDVMCPDGFYRSPYIYDMDGYSMDGYSIDSYMEDESNTRTLFMNLQEGTYLIRVDGCGESKPDVLTVSACGSVSQSIPYDFDVGSMTTGGVWNVWGVTPSETAGYVFRLADTSDDYYYRSGIHVLDSDCHEVSVSKRTSEYVEGQYVYTYTAGASLKAGERYLLLVNASAPLSLTAEKAAMVNSLELTQYPRQTYYYKLDKLTKDSTLEGGSKIKVQYADGTEESFSRYDSSSVTGSSYRITLPEDVPCSSTGYVLPGTYQAVLTYMDQKLYIPFTVKTVAAMPYLNLDENGQGSYTGEVENADGYGYVRFRAPEDGFYNLTLSVEKGWYIDYTLIANSAYESMNYSSDSEYTDTRYMENTTVYVRGGQSCYIRYRKYNNYSSENDIGTFALSVDRALNQTIEELQCNTPVQVSNASYSEAKWYSFTPEESGYYILMTQEAGDRWPDMELYDSPDSSDELRWGYYVNGRNRSIRYDMTAGRTYYVKLYDFTGTLGLTLVKESAPVGLELLTEGEIYCSSLPDYIDNSFSDLLFRITYEDGTAEEMTFGYHEGGSSGRRTSLHGYQMSYTQPDWEYDENNYIVDKEYTVVFSYQGKQVTTPVTARSIQDLESAESAFTVEVPSGKYRYYQFTPEADGYYRFTAKAEDTYASLDLFDPYMKLMAADYSNSYWESSQYSRVGVYAMEADSQYCLRIGNSGSEAQLISCSHEMLSPASKLIITGMPKTVYYDGVDSQYSESGLKVEVTYENGDTETLTPESPSEKTGLALSTRISGSETGNHYLGGTGTKEVCVSYMGMETNYSIDVLDNSGIPEMSSAAPYTGSLESEMDDIYVKLVADESGYYWISLAGGNGTVPNITAVRNSGYTNQTVKNQETVEENGRMVTRCLTYLLAGKTYYLKGYLTSESGARAADSYTASMSRLDDLRDGLLMGELAGYGMYFCQFTAGETGYYQIALDAGEAVSLRVNNSSFSAVSVEEGSRNSRRYYIAKLQAGSVYLVSCQSSSDESRSYTMHASKKAEVQSISLVQKPEKLTYYTQFESSINAQGLVILITYSDGTTEQLAFGEKSSWGVKMSLDLSGLEKDENGRLKAGTQTVGCSYLGRKTSYQIEAVEFDVAAAENLEAEKLTAITIPAGESVFCVFTPEQTATYRFYSRGETEVFGYIYNENGTLMASNGGNNRNDFSLVSELTGGQTYILRVRALLSKETVNTAIKLHDQALFTEVTGVSLSQTELVFGSLGATAELKAEVFPPDAKDTSVIWSTSDDTIASVDQSGTVTSVKEGTAEITVTTTDGGYTASCRVIVDTEIPVITAVYPSDQSILGPDVRTLWIYTHDENGVEKVEVEYRKKTDTAYQKVVFSDKDEDSKQDSVILAELPLDDFADGDTMEVRMTAVDKGGLRSEFVNRTYTIDKKAPEISGLSAVYNTETLTVDLSWTGSMETDISCYDIYRKLKDAEDTTYVYLRRETGYVNSADYSCQDASVENKEAAYTYRIAARDKCGNSADYTVDVETAYINQAPVPRLNCAATMVSGKSYTFDLSASTDDRQIVEYTIDYGDGTETERADTAGNAVFEHAYTLAEGSSEQTFTAVVTVTDQENVTSSLEKKIRVVNLDDAGMLTVQVVDTDGIPLGNAPVYFNMGEEGQVITNTDRSGKAEFTDVPGFYAVGTYVSGYLPYKTTVELKLGETDELTIILEEKELVEAEFESHRMTLDEIREVQKETGLDLISDPESYHVLQYNVTLEYVALNIYYNGEEAFVVGDHDGYVWVPTVISDEIIVILEIPVGVSILKEFYDVKLYIMNNASEEFSLLDNHVKLNVPEGLTLMEDAYNGADVYIDSIPGQSTEVVQWMLRGDKSGEYQLSADYTGQLSDFGVPLSATFTSEEKLKVYGVDNLGVTMQIPDTFTNGEFYYNLIMKNTAEPGDDAADMYLPGLNGEGELIQTVLFREDGTKQYLTEMPEVLHAGERIERFYLITDQISDQMKEYPNYKDFVFYFREMWVKELTSYGVPLNVEILTAGELAAVYESYRALPAVEVTVTSTGAEYGYAGGDAKVSADAKPASNADYTLTYEWYDTNYNLAGTGPEYLLKAGLPQGTYHYHCVVVSKRNDNGRTAQTQYQDVEVTIAPKTVELIWSGADTRTYDGEVSDVTAALNNLLPGDTCSVTVTGGDAKDAGTHTAEVTGLDNPNYQLPENVTCEYTIEPKTVELAWSGADTRTYDGTASKVTAEATGLVGEDSCTVTVSGGDKTDAGTYTAEAKELSNPNYQLPEEKTCDYVITPKTVGLSWRGADTRTYDGTAAEVTAEATGFVGEDSCTVTVTGGDKTDAGTYTAEATELSNPNYQLPEEKTCDYVITPKTVGLSWRGADTRTYDGTAAEVTAEATGLAGEDSCTVIVTGGDKVNAGTHTAEAKELSNPNYQLPEEKTCGYVITPKTVGLSWSGNTERTYDGKTSEVTAEATGLIGEDSCTVTVTGGDKVNAGTYTAEAAALSNPDYQLPEENTCDYVITPKTVGLSWSGNTERTYDGKTSEVTAEATGLVSEDSCTVTVTGGTEKNAGSHTATAAELDNPNYQLPDDVTCEYDIRQKEIELTWSGYEPRTYNGQTSAVQAAAAEGSLVSGDVCNITVEGGTEKAAGTYTAAAVALTGADSENYVLPSAGTTQQYTIGKRQAELVWSGTDAREYNGEKSEVQAAIGNLVTGDDCTITVANGDAADPGTYTAAAEALAGKDSGNYILPAEGTTRDYTIEKRLAELVWSQTDTREYNGEKSDVNASIGNLVTGDVCTVTVEGGDAVKAGTYTASAVSLAGADSEKYQIPSDTDKSYTIMPKTVGLEWTGGTKVYDKEAAQITVKITGLIGSDICEAAEVTGADQVNAGTYTAVVTGLTNEDYRLPENAGYTYRITAKPVTVSWSGNDRRMYDGTASSVKAEAVGLETGDSCEVTVEGGSRKDAGTYTAAAVGLSNSNYELSGDTTCSYTITAKPVTVSWSGNTRRTYDGTVSSVKAEAVGLETGDSCEVTVEGGSRKDAGTFTATALGLSNSNYELSGDTTCSYTIDPRTVTLTWSGYGNRTYDGTASAVRASVGGLVSGDDCRVTVTGANAVLPGTYTASVSGLTGAAGGNYRLPANTSQTYTIGKRVAQLEWTGTETRTYDGTASAVTAAVKNLVAGDVCTVTVTGGTEVHAGSYTAVASIGNTDKYELPANASASYTITPAAQTIKTASVANKAIAGSSVSLNARASGGGTLKFASSNTKIAKVSSKGKVTMLAAGQVTITIKAAKTGDYNEVTQKLKLIVKPAKVKISKVTSPSRGKVNATWKKLSYASGYQVQYSTSKKFSKAKYVYTNNASAIKATISKLTAGKTYYVRVRAYKTISKKKYYGAFSNTVKVTVKKK